MNDFPVVEWIDDPKGHKSDAWIDLIYETNINGTYWVKASVKFDGCIHYGTAYNTPFPNAEDQDCFHFDDIDEMIKSLILLKEAAIKHFGEDWNK